MNIQDLQAQITSLETQKASLYEQGSVDADAVVRINEQIKLVQYQLSVAEQEQAVQAQVEEKVAEATAQVSSSFDSLNIGGQIVTLAELAAGEVQRQLLQIYILQMVAANTEQSEREKALLTSQLNESEEKREKIHAEYDLLIENVNEIRKQNAIEVSNLKLQLDDMATRRDAAANELAETKAEVERLNSQVDDLRTEIAVGAKSAVKVTNMDSDKAKELVKQLNESKPAIYDVQPLDNKRSQYSAKLAKDDSEVTFNYLEKGKYREVTPEEAAEIAGRFRAEQAAAEAEQAATVETSGDTSTVPVGGDLTPPQVPPIQTNDTPTNDTVGGESTDRPLETQPSIEDRIKALEIAVFGKAEVAA